MKQYLNILLRDKFRLFYRFGYTFVHESELVEFDGNITDEVREKIVKQFGAVTPFDYDEEYLILHFEKSINGRGNLIQIDIQDIVKIYPLSQQAKFSIESKIDQRINLEKPIFETVLPKIESEIERKEIEKSISALWAICKIEVPLEVYVFEIGLENIFNGLDYRKNGIKANKIQSGNYWEYLIAYDRFDYFPNSTLGYFYDAGQVFAFSKGLPTFEGSGIYNFLEQLNLTNSAVKLPDIIRFLETEKKIRSYISQTTTSNIKQYVVAPLFLMLRDEIRKSDNIIQTKMLKNIDYLKKFEDSFCYTVILLGAFFGFRKFYDAYYDSLNLRFFKTYRDKIAPTEKYQEQVPATLQEVEETTVSTENIENKIKHLEVQTARYKIEASKTNSESKKKGGRERHSDISDQYRSIIEELFTKHSEITLKDIANQIYEKTGQNVKNSIIKNVIMQMEGIEMVPKKRPETARRKKMLTTLFNE
ncbi:MAG: hypothetical protein DYG98_11150 [Haliscomenobacteraceae bacterium CHB4]|nr:hypothetical protein [Haliscomenobacteraceae bacterium CHB4]